MILSAAKANASIFRYGHAPARGDIVIGADSNHHGPNAARFKNFEPTDNILRFVAGHFEVARPGLSESYWTLVQ